MRHLTSPLASLLGLILACTELQAAEPKIQILSPKDGSRISQEQSTVLVNGKVSAQGERQANVDILFVLDTSGSTARYAGVDFGDSGAVGPAAPAGWGNPQITIYGGGVGVEFPSQRDLRNSILAAEVAGSHRLLSQLNPQVTRVGLVTFAEDARLLQPLTSDFEKMKQALDQVVLAGPYGGTNMVAGIRLATSELFGLGQSPKLADAVKVQFLLSDGIPSLPVGGSRRAAPEDTDLAINAARISGKAGIKIHVFALGEEALSYPRAAVGIAKESGGIFTPVVRPADILGILETISVVGVDFVQVFNETTGEKASHLRLAADGFFSTAVPVKEGLNQIQVLARASDGSVARDSIRVYYQQTNQRSLKLEVFLEKEKSLELQVERLGKGREEIRNEINRSREESIQRSHQGPPPVSEAPPP